MLINKYTFTLLTFALLFLPFLSFSQSFTEEADRLGIALGGNKDGGLAWADFNNDGCLDLIVNTDTNNGSRLYLSNCNTNPDNITFTDVTLTHALGLSQTPIDRMERAIIWGDFNNDGYIDFAHNGNAVIQIYLNKGPLASPAYSFGDVNQNPNFTYTDAQIPGLNCEGMAWADIDGNGWLDLVFDNHGNGVEILFKNTSGTSSCTDGFNLTEGSTLGFVNGTGDGDYLTVGDLNDDGFPDILDRSNVAGQDLFINDGDGTFTLNNNFSEEARNNNKGGVVMCDLDNDGDLDIFWTDAGRNIIYENLGGNPIAFTQHLEGAALGINPNQNIDDCACGDIDNDGDEDIFLSSDNGTNFLYKNDLNNGNRFFFVQDNGGIGFNGANPFNRDGEAAVLVDYDNDGDLDVSLNIRNANNQLWRNNLITTSTAEADRDYLKVKILIQNPLMQPMGRYAIGAQAILRRLPAEGGANVSGVKEVNGGRGHGSQDPAVLHFGLPDGAELTYELTVKFPNMAGNRTVIVTQIRPADLTDRTLVIARPAQDFGVEACNESVSLPIGLLEFRAEQVENGILLNWATVFEENNAFFTIERSKDGQSFEEIAYIEGAGNSIERLNYHFQDINPQRGVNYYRLKQTDTDGTFTYSSIIAVSWVRQSKLEIFPNPCEEVFFVRGFDPVQGVNLKIFNQQGQLIQILNYEGEEENAIIEVKQNLPAGLYYVHLQDASSKKVHKLVVR